MFKTLLLLCAVLAAVTAGYHGGVLVGPSSHGAVIRGPSGGGSVSGPDGSHIHAFIPGATVIAHPQHGGAVSGHFVPGHIEHHGHWGHHW